MHETSKAVARRLRDPAFTHYFAGAGLDVGCGADSLGRYRGLWPLMGPVTDWDRPQGDAQALPGCEVGEFAWVNASHVLEHLHNHYAALARWLEVTQSGGHVVVLVPHDDMYEQGVWPSRFNGDHKHTFTVYKDESWSPVSVNVIDLVRDVGKVAACLKIEVLHATHLPGRPPGEDQTLNPVSECAIEFVLRKR